MTDNAKEILRINIEEWIKEPTYDNRECIGGSAFPT